MTKQSEQQLWSQFRQRQEDAGAEKSLFNVLKLIDKVAVLKNYMMMRMRVMIDTPVLNNLMMMMRMMRMQVQKNHYSLF